MDEYAHEWLVGFFRNPVAQLGMTLAVLMWVLWLAAICIGTVLMVVGWVFTPFLWAGDKILTWHKARLR